MWRFGKLLLVLYGIQALAGVAGGVVVGLYLAAHPEVDAKVILEDVTDTIREALW
jgi:hypothetical protein